MLQTGQKSGVLFIFIRQVSVGIYNPFPFKPSYAPTAPFLCSCGVGIGKLGATKCFHFETKSTNEVIFFYQGSTLSAACVSKISFS
mgnify:CR=1 FL=1